MRTEVTTHSETETSALAARMAQSVTSGTVIALFGDLGAGKTAFAKGFAKGLGVSGVVTSPTFTILQIYEEGRLPLYHFDVYRIGDLSEMDETGFEEYAGADGVVLVEWAQRIEALLPEDTVRIHITRVPEEGDDARRIVIDDTRD